MYDLDRPSESSITRNILRYLKSLPHSFTWKQHGGTFGTAGMPDIGFIRQGRITFFEVKRPGNKPTDIQKAMMEKLRAAGAKCFVVHSAKEVKGIIRQEESPR